MTQRNFPEPLGVLRNRSTLIYSLLPHEKRGVELDVPYVDFSWVLQIPQNLSVCAYRAPQFGQ